MGWAERAEAIISMTEPDEYPKDNVYDAFLALVNERLDETGLRNKVWGNMTYRCDNCHSEEIYELEVGVEGPQEWRTERTYIACAFGAGRCDRCNGSMTHVRFSDDVTYDKLRAPAARYVFRVPKEWPTYPLQGMYDDGTVITSRGDSAFLQTRIV